MTDTNEDQQDKMVEDYYIQPNVKIPFFPHNGDRDKSFYAASDWAWANKVILGVYYRIADTGDGWKIELQSERINELELENKQLRADLDEAMLLHGGENGKLPVSMRFPEYLDRIAKLRDRWMARRAKHKET